ncbi:MAG: hypothetical protein ACK5RO_03050 [Pseudobdellovibrionaceae bacterium]
MKSFQVFFALVLLSEGAWSSFNFEVGGSSSGGYFTAGVDVELKELNQRLGSDLSLFSQGTVNSTKYTDSGTGEMKRELDYSFDGGGQFGFYEIYSGTMKALYLSTPDQGITASGGEIEWSASPSDYFIGLMAGSLQYQHLIQFSTRRGSRTADNSLKQDWWGAQAGYDFEFASLSVAFQKFSYDRDVVQFVNFLNQPVVDYLVGASTSWVRSFPESRSTVSVTVPFREIWSVNVSGQKSVLEADSSVERTGTVAVTYDEESRSFTLGAGSGLLFLGIQFN